LLYREIKHRRFPNTERFRRSDSSPSPYAAEFAAQIKEEIAQWAKVIKDARQDR